MKKFKAVVGDTEEFDVTEEEFERALTKDVYLKDGKKLYGVCPHCEGPTRLIGLYLAESSRTAYARHNQESVENVASRTVYTNYCPYNTHSIEHDPSDKYIRVTKHSMAIFRLIEDYFDKIIYIIKKEYGIYVSNNKAIDILEQLNDFEVWYCTAIDEGNIPWVIMYHLNAENLYGKLIRANSPLYNALKKQGIKFEKTPYSNLERFLGVQGNSFAWTYKITNHRRKIDENDNLIETFDEVVFEETSKGQVERYKRTIEIDRQYLHNLIHSEKSKNYRNYDLVEQARKVMGEELVVSEE